MLRRQALIGLTAFGIALGSGAAVAMPVGPTSLPTFQERATTAEPVHYMKRRHRHVRKRHYVHPRRYHQRHHALRRHHFVHPRYHTRRYVRPHHFERRHHYRSRPHFSFSFGW